MDWRQASLHPHGHTILKQSVYDAANQPQRHEVQIESQQNVVDCIPINGTVRAVIGFEEFHCVAFSVKRDFAH